MKNFTIVGDELTEDDAIEFFNGDWTEVAHWSSGEGRASELHTVYKMGDEYMYELELYSFDGYITKYFKTINQTT
jgi:hypothetical protein